MGLRLLNLKCVVNQFVRNSSTNLFVYGTWKSDQPNHKILANEADINYVSDGTVMVKYPLVIATKNNIPFLLYSPGTGRFVNGEIYEVDEKLLSKLDKSEDPMLCQRELDDVMTKFKDKPDKDVVNCWVYFLKKFKPDLLKLPHLDTYSSTGPHGRPFVEKKARDPKYDYKHDIVD